MIDTGGAGVNPRSPEPRFCPICKTVLVRRTPRGKTQETYEAFARRETCGQPCAAKLREARKRGER